MGNLSLKFYPEKLLFTLLDQYYEELDELDSKSNDVESVKAFRKETMVTIKLIEQILVERFKDSAKPINEIAESILNGEEHESTVYKRVFVEKIITNQVGPIDNELLDSIIDRLDIEDLYNIIKNRKGTTYADKANNKYEEMMFEVEKDVDYALEKKMEKDEILNLLDDIKQEKRKLANAPYVESPFTDDDIISIEEFIIHFLGIDLDGEMISHNDLKKAKGIHLKIVDNNFAKTNPKYVKKEVLILVKDRYDQVKTYINPEYLPLRKTILNQEKENEDLGKRLGKSLEEAMINYKIYKSGLEKITILKDVEEHIEDRDYINHTGKKLIKEIEGMDRNAKY